MNGEELDQHKVSEHSRFQDEVLSFDNPTAGSHKSASSLNWGMELFDGSRLNDRQHTQRLRWAKILMLTLLVLPYKGRSPAHGAIGGIQCEFKWLLSWMSESGYHCPRELTREVMTCYLEYLPSIMAARADDSEIGGGIVERALMTPIRLWNQRLALARMGVESTACHPYDGRGASAVAADIATKAIGWIKPIPDEIVIPLLNKAAWFLGTPADDVLRLLDVIRDPLAGTIYKVSRPTGVANCRAGTNKRARQNRALRFLATFEFGPPPSEAESWHGDVDLSYWFSAGRLNRRMPRVRILWESVRAAAVIIVQATSGMRVSELLGIQAGIDDITGLPVGVRLEQSATGLYEWFVIRSSLSKTEEGLPREVDWVLGMRPMGSVQVPVAVRALCLLNRLQEPWRARARTKLLILGDNGGTTLPVATTALRAMSSEKLNHAMRRFIARWVDLSGLPDESARKIEDLDLVPWRESRGGIFRTHMLRKTWAQFTLACDSRLLPAIQMQFHHLSLAMTEGGYIGNNPLLLDELNSMGVQKVYLAVFDSVVGKTKLAGRMGEQLECSLAQLRAEAITLPKTETWQRAVEWADRNDLKMFFTAHATCCPTRASEMRCHDASDTPVWLRKAPNTATREPSVCAGCACAIMDQSHESFWSERYVGCAVSLKQAERASADVGPFREVRFRADQARSILKKFGADLDALDARIASKTENGHD